MRVIKSRMNYSRRFKVGRVTAPTKVCYVYRELSDVDSSMIRNQPEEPCLFWRGAGADEKQSFGSTNLPHYHHISCERGRLGEWRDYLQKNFLISLKGAMASGS